MACIQTLHYSLYQTKSFLVLRGQYLHNNDIWSPDVGYVAATEIRLSGLPILAQ